MNGGRSELAALGESLTKRYVNGVWKIGESEKAFTKTATRHATAKWRSRLLTTTQSR